MLNKRTLNEFKFLPSDRQCQQFDSLEQVSSLLVSEIIKTEIKIQNMFTSDVIAKLNTMGYEINSNSELIEFAKSHMVAHTYSPEYGVSNTHLSLINGIPIAELQDRNTFKFDGCRAKAECKVSYKIF